MATVTRKRTLINPYKRKLTLKQRLAGFGGKRSKAAARSSRKRSSSTHRPRAARAARPNVSAIVTAGLPFLNPYRPHRKRKTNMAKAHSTRRRRANASRPNFRRRSSSTPKAHRTRRRNPGSGKMHRTRTRTVVKYRYRARRNPFGRRRHSRRNPSSSQGMGTKSLVMNSIVAAGNAVASRWIPQFFLGANNTGIMGYGANIAAGLAGAWAAKKFAGRSAGYAALLGLGISLVLRAANDFTPWGSALTLNGFGDTGMGALMPQEFVNPALYTGNGAEVYQPPSWRPQPAAPAPSPQASARPRAMGASTYRTSTYGVR